jgi:benzylsuccinate CoA-transferase BbsF subunit
MLAIMGAEVIKIESNAHTDINRRIGPYLNGEVGIETSGNFHRVNLGKKSCTLNLARPEAAEIAKDIVRMSDIVVSNFRNGVMDGIGLGHDVLRELKPDLILVSSSGMGIAGPNRDYVCYNEEGYAYGGLGYLTGYRDKAPGMIVGDFADYLTGTLETFAILSAVHYRSRTGRGQTIEVPMVEAVASHVPEAIMDYGMNGRVRERIGNRAEGMAPHNCFPCKGEDKWVAIAVTNDEEWKALCHAMGNPEWTQDEVFSDRSGRLDNQDEVDRLVAEWTRRHTPHEVMGLLQAVGVPAGPSLSIAEMVNDPHLNARGFFVDPEHPVTGKRPLEGIPWRSSACQPAFTHAPLLGQDNYYVFHDLLGMPDEEFARLVGEEIIY